MATQPPLTSELALALRVVHSASLLTKSVLRSLSNNVAAETKADDSPVTIADFAAQALIISALRAVYPDDAFLGEESADQLRQNEQLAERVWALVQRANSEFSDVQHVQPHEKGDSAESLALTFPASREEMLHVIDLGTTKETAKGRVWVLDPVDGTATFMTGNQYAVALCLLIDGVQQVGVIGCPNLAFNAQGQLGQSRVHEELVDKAGYGVVLSAIQGQGTRVQTMHATSLGQPQRVKHQQPSKERNALDFVESALGSTSLSQSEHRAVAETLGTKWPGTVIWSQQMKYVALTLGATDVMLRLPTSRDRYTHVWDHAGGQLLFEEVGGVIKDIDGHDIDLSYGRIIRGDRNFGMVAALPSVFGKVHEAVKAVLDRRTS